MSSDAADQLKKIILKIIQDNGPISVSKYMETVLGHPEYGYYMRQDPLGQDGDFTTAPEISQMFGEMIGLWLADVWMQFGSPAEFILLECGPGRGTLMADALRSTKSIPGFHGAVQLHLLETSPVLKNEQKNCLQETKVQWHDTLDTLPDHLPLLVIANEFFDALPVSQYEFTLDGWCERLIGYEEDAFAWTLKPVSIDPAQAKALDQPQNGKIIELSPVRGAFMNDLAKRIQSQSGAALIFDYGYLKASYGDTFQAVYKHEFVDPLLHAGDADLTAHVNFDQLEDIAIEHGLNIFGMTSQGEFLKKLGIQVYASKLLASANEKQAQDIQKALHRLTHSDEMGTLFKVMGVGYGPNIKPAGF